MKGLEKSVTNSDLVIKQEENFLLLITKHSLYIKEVINKFIKNIVHFFFRIFNFFTVTKSFKSLAFNFFRCYSK